MKILIVGGAGYVGGYVTDLLKETNNEIIIYDNLLYENQFQKDVNFIYGDVRDYKKIQKYFLLFWTSSFRLDFGTNIGKNCFRYDC